MGVQGIGSTPKEIAYQTVERKRPPFLVDVLQRLVREKPLATAGAIIVLILLLVGIFADVLAPYGLNEMVMSDRLQSSSFKHIMGTDNLGRDLFSRIIYGARISVIVGLSGAALAILVSLLIGVFSGYYGGKFDIIAQRFVDSWMCIPGLVMFLTILSVVGAGMLQMVMVLGIAMGIPGSRMIRSYVIGIKGNTYLEAARAMGASTPRILLKYVLPNIFPPVLISFTISMGTMIFAEATLSFLGFGMPPPNTSWGAMLSGSGRQYMLVAPWMALWPGLVLSLVIYGINMLGDGVRDILDPRLRGGLGRYGTSMENLRKMAVAHQAKLGMKEVTRVAKG